MSSYIYIYIWYQSVPICISWGLWGTEQGYSQFSKMLLPHLGRISFKLTSFTRFLKQKHTLSMVHYFYQYKCSKRGWRMLIPIPSDKTFKGYMAKPFSRWWSLPVTKAREFLTTSYRQQDFNSIRGNHFFSWLFETPISPPIHRHHYLRRHADASHKVHCYKFYMTQI